jgi:hypothetical protein
MSNTCLLVQLIYHGKAVWQVRQEVPADLCRRMTPAELKSLGDKAEEALMEIISKAEIRAPLAPAPIPARDAKKKR